MGIWIGIEVLFILSLEAVALCDFGAVGMGVDDRGGKTRVMRGGAGVRVSLDLDLD